MAVQNDPIREWRDQYARCCLKLNSSCHTTHSFHAPVELIFPELRIIRTASRPGFVFRDEDLLGDGNDSFEVIVAQSRELRITHRGREISDEGRSQMTQ